MNEDTSLGPFLEAVSGLGIKYDMAPIDQEYSVFTGVANEPLDFKSYAKDIPCQAACPAKTRVPHYIQAIAEGNPDKAYLINQEDNVFSGVLGRVCSRPCEDGCRHNWTDINGPVHICHLKRGASDYKKNPPAPLPAWFESTGKKVAVIGGGPAGLTAARELKRYGHEVTIFERDSMLGGMMVQGIPIFRLPRETVEAEVKAIIDSGINVEFNANVDSAKMQQLLDEYDSVLVAVGTTKAKKLGVDISGADGEEVGISGLKFMYDYNMGKIGDMEGQDVIILGGGFTAVDCARSCARAAKRMVGESGSVKIVYRRTDAQMTGGYEEIDEMDKESIDVETLLSPIGARVEGGQLAGVTFQRQTLLDELDWNGKPKIAAIEGTEEEYPCNTLIVAFGQDRDASILPEGVSHEEGHATSHEKIFVSGDFNYGSQDVITAVNDGKEAAEAIDTSLMGRQRRVKHIAIEMTQVNGETGRVRDHDLQFPPHMPTLPLGDRDGVAEVETGHELEALQVHATRCYWCQHKMEIDHDKCIHCNWCIEVTPRDCINKVSRLFYDEDGYVESALETDLNHEGTYIWIDSHECIRCGKCVRICPTSAITMRKTELCGCSTEEFEEKQKDNQPYGAVEHFKY